MDKHAHSVQNSKVIRTCLARGKILENVGFFKETRQNLPFIEKYATNKYFSINGRFCLVSLKNPTFSNIFPRAKHVLMTFEF